MDSFARSLFVMGAQMAREQFSRNGGQNQIDQVINAGTKACEIAEKNATQRSNERGSSIVVSSHNFNQKVAYKVVEKCGVTYATSVADERGEECGMPVTHECEECGKICSRCVEAACCMGDGHVNLRRL